MQESKFKIRDRKGIVTTDINGIQKIIKTFFEKCIFQTAKNTKRNGYS